MTSKTAGPITIHARCSGLTVPDAAPVKGGIPAGGRVLRQGETITLTAEQVEDTRDRNGDSWLDLSPEDQVRRWGSQKFGLGPAPDELKFGGDDSSYRIREWQRATTYADQISDPAERWAEKKRIAEEFPEFGTHSVTTGTTRARTGF